MPRHGRPLRLFVAIYPPPDLVARLHARIGSLDLPEHRLTPATHVHLTLVYIGDTPPRDQRQVEESVDRACAGIASFALTPTTLATVPLPPDRAPARLVAALTDSPSAVLELHKRLALRLAHKPADRRGHFLPHLTICRFPQDVKTISTSARAGSFSLQIDEPPFPVAEVALVNSILTRDGAVHDVVRRVPLVGRS